MKKILITLFVAAVAISGFAQTETAGSAGIQFETGTWAEILAKAKQQNKYVFVDAFTTWCGPCKWMDKNVFPTAEAGTYFNKNFINAKIDMEKGEGLDIAKKYEVRAYPTYLFVNGDGELVHRVVGSMETPKFIEASANALDPEKQYYTLVKKFDSGNRDTDFLYKASYAAQSAYDNKKAQEISAAYLATQSNLLDEKNMKFINDFTTAATDANYEFMRKNAATFQAHLGKDKYDEKMYMLAFNGAFAAVGMKRDVTKEQATQYITAANEFFNKTLPEQTPKLSSAFALNYHRVTKDWANYAKQAVEHYEKYPANSYELNSVAWTFYENVDDPAYLKKALAWGLESIRLQENYGNTDTVASLYNKLGDKAKTKEYATRAIELAKASGQDYSGTEKLLKDIAQ